jgi:hypothetical protein
VGAAKAAGAAIGVAGGAAIGVAGGAAVRIAIGIVCWGVNAIGG